MRFIMGNGWFFGIVTVALMRNFIGLFPWKRTTLLQNQEQLSLCWHLKFYPFWFLITPCYSQLNASMQLGRTHSNRLLSMHLYGYFIFIQNFRKCEHFCSFSDEDRTYSFERNSYQVTFPETFVSDLLFLCFALWRNNEMISVWRETQLQWKTCPNINRK